GGSIFVDTGWQFWVPEWEFERAPAVLPVERLTWTDYGMSDAYQLGRTTIAGQVKVDDFKPLTWEGQPWAVSGAEPGDVREWGEVVLSTDGRPLVVAGEYGEEGKVVWSGMNLVAHATYRGKNQEEIHLLHNLLGWLIEDESRGPAGQDPTVTRDHPDRVQFSLSTVPDGITWLYWREAFYPAWQAYLKTEDGERRELAIYRAGPGLMLMPIEGASGNALVELVWETPLVERMAALVSLMTLAALGVFLVDGALFGGKWFATIHKRFGWPSRGPKPRGSVEWLPDFTPE
ncbi:MAG: hypothetical protein GTO63_13180, partial [Anaerolineae bacterium]|nr:hypothetical protein [Anaerolineae bacterium]NIN95796.1 hypothetical protein [Anaerolineae bacterium]